MQRRWVVRPRPGELVVDREEVVQALMDGESHLHRSGGALSVVTRRVKADEIFSDGIPGEAHTSLVIFEWTDANGHRASAEQTVPAEAPPAFVNDPAVQLAQDIARAQAEPAFQGEVQAPVSEPEMPARRRPLPDTPMADDGLVYAAEEDNASVGAGMR